MTKVFETFLSGTLCELLAQVCTDSNQRRGELVLIVEGAPINTDLVLLEGQRIFGVLKNHLPASKAAKLAAELSGAPRKSLYQGIE